MRKRFRFTLGKKIVIMILAMSIILSTTALLVSYRTYKTRTTAFYEQLGSNVVATLASQLTAEELDRYYETLEMDERYYEIQDFITDLVASNDVEYLYVVRPHGIGVTFLFDSDMEAGENGDYAAGGYCALGTYTDLVGDFAANLDNLLEGREVEPIVQQDPSYGWLMTAMTPVCHEDGTVAGYVMADISMNDVVQEQQRFLVSSGVLLAALTAAFAVAYLLLVRRIVIWPIRRLTEVAQSYQGGGDRKSFSQLKLKSDDELGTLADAFRMMLVEIEINNMEQKELAVREQRLESELQLANQLNASVLPKGLPRREGEYPFAVQGRIHRGEELSCCFYDYFLLDREKLCVLVGEVPGGGVPQVLYTVMAQATIKSQMRSGQSLARAITAANQQLHEMSGELSINVLAGVLDGSTGRFTCINAGLPDPLFMRGQDRYEWMKLLSYAPLGQGEAVAYREAELELRQGDRLLFRTRGLDGIRDREGKCFGEEQLRMTLNERDSRQGSLEQQLQYVGDAGAAYGGKGRDREGYVMLALEYRRRDRAQAYCVVTPDAAGGAELTRFLQGQLEANGLDSRSMAKLMVLADELFTLCCRQTEPDSHMMAECAILPEESLAILRLKGDLGGRDPLQEAGEGATRDAVEFLNRNSEQVLFERSNSMDIVTVVQRLREDRGERCGNEQRE